MKTFRSLRGKMTFFSTLIVIIAMSLSVVIVYYVSYQQSLTIIRKNIDTEIQLIAGEIENGIQNLQKDLMLISKTPPISGIIRSYENDGIDTLGSSTLNQWEKRLTEIFTSILQVNPNYTQIRYIGVMNNGKEIVRVNRSSGSIYGTHHSALQEKGDSSYFVEASKLSQGSVYFSHINFNKEDYKLTYPLIPTLRVITPIYTDKQILFGLLIINVNVDNFLSKIFIKSNIDYDMAIRNEHGEMLTYNHKNKDISFNPKISPETNQNESNLQIVTKDIFSDPFNNHQVFQISALIPKSHLTLPNEYFIEKIGLWLGLITLGAVLLIYLFSSRLLKNLHDMAQTLRNSTRSNTTPSNLPTHLNDEVGLLARAFEEKTKMLDHFASFDSLTGLPNRKKIVEYLDECLINAKKNIKICACAYIDLNGFKQINDTYGHDYGDELLVKFSASLQKVYGEKYFCGRLGGDEFIVIFEDIASNDEIFSLIDKYEIELNHSYYIKGITINNVISAGLAIYPEDGKSSDELIKNADKAMYESKKEKKGKFALYSNSITV